MDTSATSTDGEQAGSGTPTATITPVLVAHLVAEGELMPVYVHVIDHPDGRVLVDTGMTELHPLVADMDPRLVPLSEQADFDLAGIDMVVNTHLHFDHCGGNHLFAGKPIYVQRRELDDARSLEDYTIREWVEAPGVQYVPVDGEFELLPGSGSCRRRGTRRGRRWWSSRRAGVRPSSRGHGGLLRPAGRAERRGSATGARDGPRAGLAVAHPRALAPAGRLTAWASTPPFGGGGTDPGGGAAGSLASARWPTQCRGTSATTSTTSPSSLVAPRVRSMRRWWPWCRAAGVGLTPPMSCSPSIRGAGIRWRPPCWTPSVRGHGTRLGPCAGRRRPIRRVTAVVSS